MKILFLTQWFHPEPIFKGLPFAKELIKRGHQVEVLTGFPNYPGGKLYDGYKVKIYQKEIIEGIPVIRVPLYPSHDSSGIKRAFNYLSFALSAGVLGGGLTKPADVMYVYHPPASIGLAAMAISIFKRIPFVYDIQDLWPDTVSASGMLKNKVALGILDVLCKQIYRVAAKITVLSPGFKRILVSRGVPEGKIEIVYNWCDEDSIIVNGIPPSASLDELGYKDKFKIMFAGTMGKLQALESVLQAAKILESNCPNVQFIFIGGGIEVPNLKRQAEVLNLKNVLFLPRKPVNEIGALLLAADVLLVHLKDDPLFRITIPSKTQAYMAVGRPILMAVKGDAANLVQDAKAGKVCVPEDPISIAQAVEEMYRMPQSQLKLMGQNGLEFYKSELSMKVGVQKYEDIFAEIKQ